MRKLFIDKNEEIAEIVERILGEEESELALVIPKGAEIAKSVSNFHLLKREADAAGKEIAIESVDDDALAYAKASGIPAAHPLFSAGARSSAAVKAGSSLSDIMPVGGKVETEKKPHSRKKRAKDEENIDEQPVKLRVAPAAEENIAHKTNIAKRGDFHEHKEESGFSPAIGEGGFGARRKFAYRRSAIAAVAAVGLVLIVWFLGGFFARATVTITLQKLQWESEDVFLADVSVSQLDAERKILPAEYFETRKNLTHLAQASAVEEVQEKASGKITIYNAFSSSPQTLVATTRFEAPDGKIFRIVNQVTVPGAIVKDGRITPSSIDAEIVADRAGPEYNVGPVPRLTIPGFAGSPRFNGFYGEIKEQTKGGFTGRRPVPTAKDIADARKKTEELLRSGLEMTFLAGVPREFKILDGASKIEIARMSVNQETDERGNFSVFGEAVMSAIGFRESDLKLLLESDAQKRESGVVFKDLNLDSADAYSDVLPDFDKKTMRFSVSSEGTLWHGFSTESLAKELAGKSIREVESVISSLPGFTGGKVALWPIWLRKAPSDFSKIKIIVE